MKINLKRVAMILLVVIALLALAIPVFAETTDNGAQPTATAAQTSGEETAATADDGTGSRALASGLAVGLPPVLYLRPDFYASALPAFFVHHIVFGRFAVVPLPCIVLFTLQPVYAPSLPLPYPPGFKAVFAQMPFQIFPELCKRHIDGQKAPDIAHPAANGFRSL